MLSRGENVLPFKRKRAASAGAALAALAASGAAGQGGREQSDRREQRPSHVFNVSLPKCGTTSLHRFLEGAGFASVHWTVEDVDIATAKRLRETGQGGEELFVGARLRQAVEQCLEPLALLPPGTHAVSQMDYVSWDDFPNWHATGDFPQCRIEVLEALDRAYPYAKFVHITRDWRDWVRSTSSWNDLRQRITYADLPQLPSGAGECDEELIAWAEGHTLRLRQVFAGRPRKLLEFRLDDSDLDAKLRESLSAVDCPAWSHHNWTWY